jgi:hypothetical protein
MGSEHAAVWSVVLCVSVVAVCPPAVAVDVDEDEPLLDGPPSEPEELGELHAAAETERTSATPPSTPVRTCNPALHCKQPDPDLRSRLYDKLSEMPSLPADRAMPSSAFMTCSPGSTGSRMKRPPTRMCPRTETQQAQGSKSAVKHPFGPDKYEDEPANPAIVSGLTRTSPARSSTKGPRARAEAAWRTCRRCKTSR